MSPPSAPNRSLVDVLQRLDEPFALVRSAGQVRVVAGALSEHVGSDVLAWVPALAPSRLGDPTFQSTYGVRANYVAGAMANGIGSTDIVIAMARAGLMGFFGAAGLPTQRIEQAIDQVQAAVGDLPYGFNLIHSPAEPYQEWDTAELYARRGVRTVSASAYLRLTPQIVWYRCKGLTADSTGRVQVPHRVLAKVSREEVAIQFLRPPPPRIVEQLRAEGRLTQNEARLAAQIPMADDLIAEADSGGHTDNQAAPVLIPLMCALRDRVVAEQGYDRPVRVGAAGGITTPAAAAAAFTMGAAFVLTGTVNQACVEAGTSPMVKAMLAEASVADVGMAPASDMFEAGVEVQVLKRGTMFAARGHKLRAAWRDEDSLESLDAATLDTIERTILRRPVGEVWAECEAFFAERDPAQLERASADPKHKMALVFRWYLGLSSRWAIAGDEDRRADVQVWCGPGIGAFNDWTRGTFLEGPEHRTVVAVAANILAGAAAITRARMLQQQGIAVDAAANSWTPRPLA